MVTGFALSPTDLSTVLASVYSMTSASKLLEQQVTGILTPAFLVQLYNNKDSIADLYNDYIVLALKNPKIALQLINKGFISSVTGKEKAVLAEILDLISRDSNVRKHVDSARLMADAYFIEQSDRKKTKKQAGEVDYAKEIERRLETSENTHK